jgi:outer membrane protein assembly factor BamE (lipoprotein component of BamABCDE complex)
MLILTKSKTMFARAFLFFALAGVIAGCSQTIQSGPQIQQTDVSKIQKGVTKRAQIDAMFGAPTMVTLLGDGRRMAIYSTVTSNSSTQFNPVTAIPIVGLFAGDPVTATTRTQSLQVIYNASQVVVDYEFTDNTTNMSASPSALGSTTIQSTGAPPSANK